MSLEQAMEKLAASMDRYADVIEKYGLQVQTANSDKSPAEDKPSTSKATKTTGKTKPAAKEEADDDGFEEKKPAANKKKKAATFDDVKAVLLKIKEVAGDKAPALELIAEFGYDGIPKIQEKDFEGIIEKANEWLEENE